ncbi:hypothetical protein FHU41_002895 [Psychromicrobium silvestre]|uniref:Uncharacterized protein n=1 Tax=Psychromicrobium silvestre TaxID=1645614 RepID=A0A7Y9LW64_9MICC|nr:hypothetical protein [Psychromicrobium silvestre]NYE96645.1 hypothetical protein [Psychromicrobium silvestre]
MMTAAQIYQQLTAQAQGTPYTVTPIEGGLRVHLNVADLHWLTLFYEYKLDKEYSINLLLDEAHQVYSREQIIREMRWKAGAGPLGFVPYFEAAKSVKMGSMIEISAVRTVGLQEDGSMVGGYNFDSREMSRFVDAVMVPSGWKKKMDKSTKLGLGFALGGVGFAILAVAFALILTFSLGH